MFFGMISRNIIQNETQQGSYHALGLLESTLACKTDAIQQFWNKID